jgi:hypothetical protein
MERFPTARAIIIGPLPWSIEAAVDRFVEAKYTFSCASGFHCPAAGIADHGFGKVGNFEGYPGDFQVKVQRASARVEPTLPECRFQLLNVQLSRS